MPSKRWTCVKCNHPFETRSELESHLAKQTPCDFKCKWCDQTSNSRRSYFYHQRKCPRNPDNRDSRDIVYLQLPVVDHFDLLHNAEKRHEMFAPIQSELIRHFRQEDLTNVWRLVFRTVHANPQYPEYQNIFAPSLEHQEILTYALKDGAFEKASLDSLRPSWLRHLRDLIRKVVWDMPKDEAVLTELERDQWLHDVTASWRSIDEPTYPLLMEMLHENRHAVRRLFEMYQIRLDVDLVKKYYDPLGRPAVSEERTVHSPNPKLLV